MQLPELRDKQLRRGGLGIHWPMERAAIALMALLAVLINWRNKMSRLDDVIRKYDAEVEAEAVMLIKSGMPPFEAMEQAKTNVRVNRLNKASEDRTANPMCLVVAHETTKEDCRG